MGVGDVILLIIVIPLIALAAYGVWQIAFTPIADDPYPWGLGRPRND